MPELPDISIYLECIEQKALGHAVTGIRLGSPFVLRTVEPPREAFVGARLRWCRRIGKQLVLGFSGDLAVAIHLMVAGRLLWELPQKKLPGRIGLAAIDFDNGALVLTEVSTKKRAAVRLLRGAAALGALDRGGLEVVGSTLLDFSRRMKQENHTLKRALTDPRLFAGIGNAYSDEILFAAALSPVKQTKTLDDAQLRALHRATQQVCEEWIGRLRADLRNGWPRQVTAFRPEMAVHGRYGQPCRQCETPIQRIVRATNEANYCPKCQTGGKLLADRSLSRLLRNDWPASLDELEEYVASRADPM